MVSSFAKLFDHSIVRPDATSEMVLHAAEAAARLGTATLTVQPHYIRFAVDQLRGTDVLVGTVVGFPHGNETPSMKECRRRFGSVRWTAQTPREAPMAVQRTPSPH